MTFAKFFSLGLILSLLAAVAKIIFLNGLNQELAAVQYGFWLFIVLLTVACVRRLGVINYLEVVMTLFVWFGVMLVVDLLLTASFVGLEVFTTFNIWIANILVPVSVWLFHKKRHVQIRKEHAAHGGHH